MFSSMKFCTKTISSTLYNFTAQYVCTDLFSSIIWNNYGVYQFRKPGPSVLTSFLKVVTNYLALFLLFFQEFKLYRWLRFPTLVSSLICTFFCICSVFFEVFLNLILQLFCASQLSQFLFCKVFPPKCFFISEPSLCAMDVVGNSYLRASVVAFTSLSFFLSVSVTLSFPLSFSLLSLSRFSFLEAALLPLFLFVMGFCLLLEAFYLH